MVHYSLPSLALLVLSASVAAIPTASTKSATPFSFAQWIEDIIANPNGDHLTPEEAVAAKKASLVYVNPLVKRAAWYREDIPKANANDAAACLKNLASKGANGQNCVLSQGQGDIQMCSIGDAQIVRSKRTNSEEGANCNDIARTGGLIFDGCYRNDGTVRGSDTCVSNDQFQVNISGF